MKILLIGFVMSIFLLSFKSVSAQEFDSTNAQNIKWEKNILTANNFRIVDKKDISPDSNHFAAVTSNRISYRYQYRNKHLIFWIQTYFNYSKSWIQKPFIKNKQILKHEQGHFDLAEIESRNFATALHNYSFTDNFKEEIPMVFKVILNDLKAIQARYDEQTKHGTDSDAQKQWNIEIEKLLNSLSPADGTLIELDIH